MLLWISAVPGGCYTCVMCDAFSTMRNSHLPVWESLLRCTLRRHQLPQPLKNSLTPDEARLCLWPFWKENCLLFGGLLICERNCKEPKLKDVLVEVLMLRIVTPERLLITFRNNLIFSGSEDETLQVVALSFTNNHLNLATKETQVLPKSQLMRE